MLILDGYFSHPNSFQTFPKSCIAPLPIDKIFPVRWKLSSCGPKCSKETQNFKLKYKQYPYNILNYSFSYWSHFNVFKTVTEATVRAEEIRICYKM